MATWIVSPSILSIPPAEPPRCNQEITTGQQTAILCGALADVLTESGSRCAACLAELGGTVVTEISPLWVRVNIEAARELDTRFRLARIGNGLFVRMGRTKGGRNEN